MRGSSFAALLAWSISFAVSVAPSLAPAAPQVSAVAFKIRGDSAQPSVAALPGEGFIVTWQVKDGSRTELWFAQLDTQGRELRRGRIARGENWFVNWADFPSLVVLENGDWVTYWLQKPSAEPGEAYSIQLTRSTDRGKHWSAPITPHTDATATQHGFVSLLPDGGDRVLAVWLDGRRAAELTTATAEGTAPVANAGPGAAHGHDEEAAPMTLRAATLDRTGKRTREALLDDMTCSCCQTDAARWVGRVLVAYRDRSPKEIRDISVVARSATGVWSAPRTLHADNWEIAGCPVNGPALAVNGERLLAIWPTLVGERMVVRYQIRGWDKPSEAIDLDPAGERVRGRVDAAVLGDGFLVSWLGGQDQDAGPRVGFVDSDGRLAWHQRLAVSGGARAVGFARLAGLGDRVLAAWTVPAGERRSTIQLALVQAAANQP